MKIVKWTDNRVYFSDDTYITYDHLQDCCEYNYADFSVLDVMYHDEEFESYKIETVEEAGFLLKLYQDDGDKLIPYGRTGYLNIFIPCYSDQNGYYTSRLDIYCYDKDEKLVWKDSLDCERRIA